LGVLLFFIARAFPIQVVNKEFGARCLPSLLPAQGQNLSHALLAIKLARKVGA
jgi:hypothetical protein